MEKKLMDEEIVKALECCSAGIEGKCSVCLFRVNDKCAYDQKYGMKIVLDLIHRLQEENGKQKAEIERLTAEIDQRREMMLRMDCNYATELQKNTELQKQVDELKAQLKSVQSACQSKNEKIKTLNSEKEALQNELNFQNGKPHYRYVVWNTMQNKRQFPSICELTESGAYTKLFQKIGWDSAKYRFEVRRIKVDSVEVE